jgi:phospholipase C
MNSPIEHIVVLMLENRSFDHMLGFLPKKGNLRSFEGLTGNEYNLLDVTNPESDRVYVQKSTLFEFEGTIPGGGPPHDFLAANQQLTGTEAGPSPQHPALNNGFVQSFVDSFAPTKWNPNTKPPTRDQLKSVMGCFAPQQVPALSTLAQEFMLCDHWFSSVPGPTMPNRLYMHTGTSAGFAVNAWSQLFPMKTIYNSLAEKGYSWGIYYANNDIATELTQITYDKDQLKKFDLFFVADVNAQKLPNYSFIIPRFLDWNNKDVGIAGTTSQHAPADIRPGEALIAQVYNTLRANAEVWKKTLLVVLYDEHGGFYDHVIPPSGVPNPDGLVSPTPTQLEAAKKANKPEPPPFDFTRLGFRVPAVLVSPWLPKELNSTYYDHTSILATLKNFFGLKDFLTERDRAANSFEYLLTGAAGFRNDTPERLPALPVPKFEDSSLRAQRYLDSVQREIMEGTISKIPDAQQREELRKRLAAGLTQKEAAEIMDEVMEGFKAALKAAGGSTLRPVLSGGEGIRCS